MKRMILAGVTAVLIVLALVPVASFAEAGGSGVGDENETPYPVSADFAGVIEGYPGGDTVFGIYGEGNNIQVKMSDGSMRYYLAGTHTYDDGKGHSSVISGFFLDGADPEDPLSYADVIETYYETPLVEGINKVYITVYVPYLDQDKEVAYKRMECEEYRMWVSVEKPVNIEFKPAEGFIVQGVIGNNNIDEYDFYGEGNSFVVTYEYKDEELKPHNYDRIYEYVKTKDEHGDTVEGFYWGGNTEFERLDFPVDGFDFDFPKKGVYEVECNWENYVDWQDDPIVLPFKATVDADRYETYVEYRAYEYTGKVVTPKFVVRRLYDDKKIPASQYTYKTPKNRKMGWYDVEIKYKDAYKDKYTEPVIEATYSIGPAAPKITKATGGRKKITVNWKKFTAKQLKYIDGMVVEVATDKNFYKNVKSYRVTGKALKAGKKSFGGLKAGKKYYVRMFSYKTKVKQDGQTFSMQSGDSNVKTARTAKAAKKS